MDKLNCDVQSQQEVLTDLLGRSAAMATLQCCPEWAKMAILYALTQLWDVGFVKRSATLGEERGNC